MTIQVHLLVKLLFLKIVIQQLE